LKLCFNFCKTNRRPYDADVLSSLFILKHHIPEIEIASDGQNNDDTFEDIIYEGYNQYEDFMINRGIVTKKVEWMFNY
jgi:hypothetical protein